MKQILMEEKKDLENTLEYVKPHLHLMKSIKLLLSVDFDMCHMFGRKGDVEVLVAVRSGRHLCKSFLTYLFENVTNKKKNNERIGRRGRSTERESGGFVGGESRRVKVLKSGQPCLGRSQTSSYCTTATTQGTPPYTYTSCSHPLFLISSFPYTSPSGNEVRDLDLFL
jgi:hypothetical protein